METRLMQLPLISVVTVVYNDIAHIVETMDSVVGQDYPQIEYIIIDGASSDGTREKIMEYIVSNAVVDSKENTESQSRIYLTATHREKNLRFKFLSEADSGIYDAMNKGIDLATGEWCNFMNCGDRFYDFNVLSNVAPLLDTRYGIVDGGIEIVYDENHKKIKYYDIAFGPFKIEFCHHQASFIQTHLLKQYHYDTNFKILADTHLFAQLYQKEIIWKKIPNIIAMFNTQGISQQLSLNHFKESIRVISLQGNFFCIIHTLYYILYIIPRVCIRKLLPKQMANFIRQRLK